MNKYWKGSQAKRLMNNLVWIPRYRKRVLKGKIAEKITELLYECADMNRWKIEEFSIQEDHVHVLVDIRQEIRAYREIKIFLK